jgi:hypothetical protein
MTVLADRGISIDIPSGWDAEMYQRPAEEGETTNGIVHIANFALPQGRGDYGGGATKDMGSAAILIVLFEFDPESAGTRQFSTNPVPRALRPDQFDPNTLQRPLPGQGGAQIFCNEAGRAFCLYVVLGGYSRRSFLLRSINAVLATLRIEPLEALEPFVAAEADEEPAEPAETIEPGQADEPSETEPADEAADPAEAESAEENELVEPSGQAEPAESAVAEAGDPAEPAEPVDEP